MLQLASQLRLVCKALKSAAIPFAAVKGASLAMIVFGDLAAREYNDIDIVVPRGEVEKTERTLLRLGYVGGPGDLVFRQAFLAHQGQFALHHRDTGISIDLHWSLSGVYLPFPLATDEVWDSLVPVTIGDVEVPTVAGAELALLLAGHGTKEQWRSLGWLRDFSVLLERQQELDWMEIHRRATVRGCGDTVLLGCALASSLLGVAPPPPLAGEIQSSVRVRRLARSFTKRLKHPTPMANFSDFALCERLSDKLKAATTLALTPTVGDYEAMPLPPALWRLYYATRPFRLAAKTLGGRLPRG